MTKVQFNKFLKLSPCSDAVEWLKQKVGHANDINEIWFKCDNPYWMFWLIAKLATNECRWRVMSRCVMDVCGTDKPPRLLDYCYYRLRYYCLYNQIDKYTAVSLVLLAACVPRVSEKHTDIIRKHYPQCPLAFE